jgi:uncharacterized protein (TIGR00255 family)
MILSMTGFGRSTVENQEYHCEVEVRSLNHRYCDVVVKLPKQVLFLEPKVRRLVQYRVHRGKVDLSVKLVSAVTSTKGVVVDYALAGEIARALKEISRTFAVQEPEITPFLKEIVTICNGEQQEDAWSVVEEAVAIALDSLVEFRRVEGEALVGDIYQLVDRIEDLTGRLEALAGREPGFLQKRLEERLEELEVNVDSQRLAQEVAFIADKVDIREEIVRMKSHLAQWRSVMDGGSPCGRRLDFLTQEMHREASTMASKSRDAQIISLTVDLRDEIGKLKEQVQNIE